MADDDPDFTEHTLESRTVYDGRLLKVLEDRVRLPDGASARREVVRHPGAVAMLAMPDSTTVLLVRQYRYALRRHFHELPAGKIDPGEDAMQSARRELREEAGRVAGEWRHLTTLHPCIGYSDERIELYLARELRPAGTGHGPDDGEFLQIVTVRLAQALAWVKSGRITDVKTIAGLMWADRFL